MEKAAKALFVILFVILTVSGALATDKKNKHRIKTIDKYVAIFDFEVTTGDKSIVRPLTESVRREILLSGKYTVIDRGNMEKILGEHRLQLSGCVTGECIVETGQLLGVGKLIGGTVSIVGKTYYLTLSLISVKTGEIENIAEDTCKCEVDELLNSTKRLAMKLLYVKGEQPMTSAQKLITVVESKTEATAKAEQIAKAKAEEIERAKAEAIAKSAGTDSKITNSVGMTFVYIKPGTFMMGSPSYEPGRDKNQTQHQVTLTRGFYMQTTEVTQGQWQTIMGNNPSNFKNCGEDCPVEQISWNNAQEFVLRLNQKEGVNSYRLPTEAEWEYAARAGTTTPFNTGNCLSTDQANYDGNNTFSGCSKGEYKKTTVRTGAFLPNAWGLYDMHGNVWEWCQDWYGDYPAGSVTDPVGPSSGSSRVDRGGSWNVNAASCRSANRDISTPGNWNFDIGFRLIKEKTGNHASADSKEDDQKEIAKEIIEIGSIDQLKNQVESSHNLKTAGVPGGVIKTIVPTGAINTYKADIYQKIQQNWAYSEQLGGSNSEQMAVIVIKIMPGGEISQIWFERKSGNRLLDESAYRAVQKSDPLPPIPKEYNRPYYEVGLRFGASGLNYTGNSTPAYANKDDQKDIPRAITEDELYTLALQQYDMGRYQTARENFQEIIVKYPESDKADNCQFWIGESFYQEKWYEKAILEYQKVIEKYPKGNKVQASLLKQGLSFYNIGDKQNATLVLNELIQKYPKSNEAIVASKKLKGFN